MHCVCRLWHRWQTKKRNITVNKRMQRLIDLNMNQVKQWSTSTRISERARVSEGDRERGDDGPQEKADSLQLSVSPHLHNHKIPWVLQLCQYCANGPHISVCGQRSGRVGGRWAGGWLYYSISLSVLASLSVTDCKGEWRDLWKQEAWELRKLDQILKNGSQFEQSAAPTRPPSLFIHYPRLLSIQLRW